MNHTTYENKHTEHWDRNGKQYLLDGKQRCQILGWEKTTEYHTFIFFFFFTGQRLSPPFGGPSSLDPFFFFHFKELFTSGPLSLHRTFGMDYFPILLLGFMGYRYLFNSIVNIDSWNAIGHMMRKNCMNLVGYTYIDGPFLKENPKFENTFFTIHTHSLFHFLPTFFWENIILSSRLDD